MSILIYVYHRSDIIDMIASWFRVDRWILWKKRLGRYYTWAFLIALAITWQHHFKAKQAHFI